MLLKMKVITFSINVVFVRGFPVGKIAEKAASRSVFLTIWHCILLFGDFAHWLTR